MLVILRNKTEFLQMLPKGGKWAEIGVYRGDLSEDILNTCEPSELHLIDPWHFDLDFDWFSPPDFSATYGDARRFVDQVSRWTGIPEGVHLNEFFEALYQITKRRFSDHPKVTIHRKTAHAAAGQFTDGYLDFVYVDGAHDYENVLHDLQVYDGKVKPEGAIIGDDYCNHGIYANAVYGVVGAVTQFRKTNPIRDLVLNADTFTTYGLFRPGSRAWQVFMDNVIKAGRPTIELPDALAANYWHRPVFASDGNGRLIQSFA
jgi:Methyltransferase domain